MRENLQTHRANPPKKLIETPGRLPETETRRRERRRSLLDESRKGAEEMYRDHMTEMHKARLAEYRAEAEQRRLAKLVKGETLSWRANAARRLFDAAFALEAEESWRAVWDRMSGKRSRRKRRKRRLFGKKYAN